MLVAPDAPHREAAEHEDRQEDDQVPAVPDGNEEAGAHVDDQEFMTAFECDEPSDFMHLMLTLRDSEASRYTERDTPIFVGRHVEIREALDELDGAGIRAEA